jgi:hypothetical protein
MEISDLFYDFKISRSGLVVFDFSVAIDDSFRLFSGGVLLEFSRIFGKCKNDFQLSVSFFSSVVVHICIIMLLMRL